MRRSLPILRPWLILALVCGGFSLHPAFLHTFWTRSYLPNIAQQAAGNIILAVGMTFVILTAGIDLSVGSVLALSGVALGLTLKAGAPLALGLAAALATGAGCGLINGLTVALGRVPPFVVTLGMLTAARGLTVFVTGGASVSPLPARLGVLGQGWPLVGLALATVAAGAVLLGRTKAGRYLVAIGGNDEAARLSGVNLAGYKTLAYVLSGLAAGLGAIVVTAKFLVADTGAGVNAELNAIAAVVIGGTRLSGGRGSVIGSLVGALTIAVLNAGLVLIGVRDTLQGVVIGAVIVLTVMVDQRTQP
jgi:ribose/xylose/arabinose/galactoside ABC-type transport system permease subunit